MYDFHNSTDTLKFCTEKQAINETFFFHLILMKLREIVVHMDIYNFTKFHQNRMKNKKVSLIACFSVQNFKVSVELWKSYIVRHMKIYYRNGYVINFCYILFFIFLNFRWQRSNWYYDLCVVGWSWCIFFSHRKFGLFWKSEDWQKCQHQISRGQYFQSSSRQVHSF